MNGTLSSDILPTELGSHDTVTATKVSSAADEQQRDQLSVVSMGNKAGSPLAHSPEVELAHATDALSDTVSTEETVYTSGISGGLDDENLNVTQTPNSAITTSSSKYSYRRMT